MMICLRGSSTGAAAKRFVSEAQRALLHSDAINGRAGTAVSCSSLEPLFHRHLVTQPRRRSTSSTSSNSVVKATTTAEVSTSSLWPRALLRKPEFALPRTHLLGSRVGGARRCYTPRPRPSEVITTTKLTIAGGTVTIRLPLPGVPGLTEFSLPLDVPVRDLVKEINARDPSLSMVDVANADGNKVASSTAMVDIADRGLLIALGGKSRIRVVSEEEDRGADEVPAPEIYALLKAEITTAGRVTLTRDALDKLCGEVYRKASPDQAAAKLDPLLADAWLRALVDDGLVFTADKGRAVLLNPSGPGVSDEIARALRRDDELIDLKVARLRKKLDAMYVQNARLQGIKDTLIAKAHRNVTLKKGAVLAFMTGQFVTLAYFVYEVYSWDVMEPATYFLMLSYSVGSSIYFSANNREASFNNLKEEAIKKREAALKPMHGYSKSGHQALEDNIKRYEDAVKLLSSHRDAHPPVDPSRM